MSTIVINGVSYSGNSIVVSNNKVIIDGKDMTPNEKQITIMVDGDVNDLNISSCNKLTVNGNVNELSTQSGSVNISGDVNGSVKTMSGSVNCGKISGSVKTMSGSIIHK